MDDYRFLRPADFQNMCHKIIQIRDNVQAVIVNTKSYNTLKR